jgi:microcystin-dependent protein
MNFAGLTAAGSTFPHNNMQPYLTLLYIIAMQGVFPSRG